MGSRKEWRALLTDANTTRIEMAKDLLQEAGIVFEVREDCVADNVLKLYGFQSNLLGNSSLLVPIAQFDAARKALTEAWGEEALRAP
jgi:hypothetical protein